MGSTEGVARGNLCGQNHKLTARSGKCGHLEPNRPRSGPSVPPPGVLPGLWYRSVPLPNGCSITAETMRAQFPLTVRKRAGEEKKRVQAAPMSPEPGFNGEPDELRAEPGRERWGGGVRGSVNKNGGPCSVPDLHSASPLPFSLSPPPPLGPDRRARFGLPYLSLLLLPGRVQKQVAVPVILLLHVGLWPARRLVVGGVIIYHVSRRNPRAPRRDCQGRRFENKKTKPEKAKTARVRAVGLGGKHGPGKCPSCVAAFSRVRLY